jgi:hypothetical protein
VRTNILEESQMRKIVMSSMLADTSTQGILYTGGRGWYRICCRQPTVGLVVSKIKQNIFYAQTATF